MGEQTIVPEVLLDKAIKLGVSFSDSTFPIGIFPLRYETSLLTRFPYRLYCIGNAGGYRCRHREYIPCSAQTRLARECNALCGISWTPWHEQKSSRLALR